MKDGVLLINKADGMTSFDVVARVRKMTGTRQVGHTGTLDPMATGLLAVMVGRAVKASEYLTLDEKRYTATLRLGITTDTEDITGSVLSTSNEIPSASEVVEVCSRFVGETVQVPPMYSAIKKNGKKLYELARQGIEVEREERRITISFINVTATERLDEYVLDVRCSKGTYIRTLCADIGAALGCGGVMASLKRTEVGDLLLENAHTLCELENMTEAQREALILPTEELFSDCDKVVLPPFYARLAHSGCEIYQKKLGLDFENGRRLRLCDEYGFFRSVRCVIIPTEAP